MIAAYEGEINVVYLASTYGHSRLWVNCVKLHGARTLVIGVHDHGVGSGLAAPPFMAMERHPPSVSTAVNSVTVRYEGLSPLNPQLGTKGIKR